MKNSVLATAAAAALLAGVLGFSVASFGMDRKEVETIVREAIMKDPKIVVDALEKYQADQYAAQQSKADEAALKSKDWLFENKAHPTAGKKDGVMVAEFFDYNCGYCKHAYPDIVKIMDEENARVVLIDMPILGESSMEAAKWALAADKQGKYFEYHKALMEHKGPKDADVLQTLAERAGLNVEQLKKDKDDPAIEAQLKENISKAESIGLTGTPAFVTTKEVIRGYVGYDGLAAVVKRAKDAK